ncbi:TetR family transcriptional regulator [Kitasatospora xanthocidica]|uniref:TetR/AcrR family transcriptional regulator n=1 Tax=Kitasatospora xanthocidica TaxID=83382 RepID=UPI001674BBCA|nr:TetR family transcriptional regulator [Kitasatospora xanthocidica]GHF85417.1 TetR family transcriptional regulator [Kitasatospora xanthocidica]
MEAAASEFRRARSPEAKRQREASILEAARALGRERGIRDVSLTDIAAAVGMHKSALLRYFETREEIYLRLTAEGWQEWSDALTERLREAGDPGPATVARAFAATLAARGMFCDLLAHAPLNLERNVSLDAVREFKLATRAAREPITAAVRAQVPALDDQDVVDLVATAVALAGAMWQIANPGAEVAALYRSDPRLSHAVIEVEPRLTRILTATILGLATAAGTAQD